ncbi:MAG: trypsin-like peptidase domain-containing protein [Planctomycetota bacterium]
MRSLVVRAGLAVGVFALPLGAQITQPGQPASDWAQLTSEVPTVLMPGVDVEALLAEDEVTGPFPLRYGEVLYTDMSISEEGVWEGVPEDDSLVWRLRVHSPGAHSIGLVFSEWEIPAGGQLFLYNDTKGDMLGAYGEHNNNVNGSFGIEPVDGDSVTIEYVHPSWATEMPILTLGEVIHDYKNLRNLLEASGTIGSGPADGGCGLVGINCPEASAFQTAKRSVMRTLSGGSLCSASLINNTSQDATPYMLTANHCGNMTNGQFLFKYEQASCGTSSGPQSSSLSGSVKLAGSGTYDSQLYRLNSSPPTSYDPLWAGWSRQTFTGSPVATIGHGGGGPKNIAIDNNGASLSGTDWQVFWNVGYIIGGNSGGPLFNGQQRVIGPACCVNTFTCGVQTAWYGRFDLFYNAFNLGTWLDSAGTGQLVLDSLDPFASPATISSISPSSVEAFAGGTVTINGAGFLGATSVDVGSATLSTPGGFTIVDDNTITFSAPTPDSLGTVSVDVTKPIGTSNSVNLSYVETSPPKLTVTAVTVTGLNVGWNFGAAPGDAWFLFAKLDNTTVPFSGFDLLLDPIFLGSGNLDSVGVGNEGIVVPPGLTPGAFVYSQAVLLDGGTFAFSGATNVGQTQVLL